MSFLSAEKISAGYGGHPILADVSFQLEQGCMMGILGANGCGKTTLLKTICGILPHKGTCLLEQTVLEQLSARRDGTTGWIYSPKKRYLHRHIGAGCGADGI